MSDVPAPKVVEPMTFDPQADPKSPMVMTPRPEWVEARPPVGQNPVVAVEPQANPDPTVINQPDSAGTYPAPAGTPPTVDPATGHLTGTASTREPEPEQEAGTGSTGSTGDSGSTDAGTETDTGSTSATETGTETQVPPTIPVPSQP